MSNGAHGETLSEVKGLLEHARRRGVRLWSENGQVRYKGPKGALSPREMATLSSAKTLLAALLESGTVLDTTDSGTVERVPLAHSQLAHWSLYRLHERPAIRQLAVAIRLHGRLRLDTLNIALQELVRRHAALRTRVVVHDGTPVQEIGTRDPCEIEVRDLTSLPESERDKELLRLIDELILRPIDVAHEPLFGIQCVQWAPENQVLIVAMEHMISDAISLNIFVHDLFVTYSQSLQKQTVSPAKPPIPFHEYTRDQHERLPVWLAEHEPYWTERLAGMGRVRFPQDRTGWHPTRVGWAEAPVRISPELKKTLQSTCQTRRTTLVMGVLTAYVASILRWCNVAEVIIPYVTDGRLSAKLQKSIGYFASTLYLRASATRSDSLERLLGSLMREYCNAYEHADASYITAQNPRPELTRNSAFNWVPEEPTTPLSALAALGDTVSSTLISFVHPMLRTLETDSEPSLLLYDRGPEVTGSLCYPINRFSPASMQEFVTSFLSVLQTLAHQPDTQIQDLQAFTHPTAAVNA